MVVKLTRVKDLLDYPCLSRYCMGFEVVVVHVSVETRVRQTKVPGTPVDDRL